MLGLIFSLNRVSLLTIALCWSVAVFAQPAKKVRFADKSAEERTNFIVSVLKNRLTLTQAQEPKIRDIVLASEKQRDTDFKASRGNKDALSDARKKRNAALVVEFRKVLTADQMHIFNKNRLELRNEWLKQAGVQVED